MLGRTDSRRRLLFLIVVFVTAAVSLALRLAWWQVVEQDRLATAARQQTTRTVEIPSRRGSIFDRSGTVVLATSIERWRLSASPDQLSATRRAEVAEVLVGVLGLEGTEAQALRDKLSVDDPYVVLARDLDEEMAERIRTGLAQGTLAAVALDAEPTRVYPQGGGAGGTTLAAHLLGFVNREGEGQYGVEGRYQDVLAGMPKVVVARKDSNSRLIPESAQVLDPGVAGSDISLTIDTGLQLAVEQEVFAAWAANNAKSVSAVVIDPFSGEIYAEATYPSYDANQYRQVAQEDPSRFLDPVVSSVYEPGSVFKMLTAIAALEQGVVTPGTKVNDSGVLKLDGGRNRVYDSDRKAMGRISFEDVIAYSRNVGVARVALELGDTLKESAARLYEAWMRLGFGRQTGIDVAGEVSGLVNDPTISDWRQIDLANGSFGQGVAVTVIQLAAAYSAMINGGTLVQPHVVRTIGSEDLAPVPQARHVITPQLSSTLTKLMRRVVTEVDFYRDRTMVPGYLVGGKTGTAQIWDSEARDGKGDWKDNVFNFSFVGYIGKEKPRLVVAVRINEARPSVRGYGALDLPVMSFELFRRVATDAITMLDIPPEPPAVIEPSPSPDQ